MSQIALEIPEDLIGENSALREEDVVRLAREALLVRLYALGHISSGRCAELLKMPRRAFLDVAADYGVSMFAEPDDLYAEAERGIS